jgi:hypothetical protein
VLTSASNAAQQQVQQVAMLAQQNGMQVTPEQLQGALQEQMIQLVSGLPMMREEFVQNDIGHLDVDIVLETSPHTGVVEQEEFEKLAELAGTGMVKIPPEVLVEASQLRNKRRLREMLQAPPPDKLQQQMAQIQVALAQAEVEKVRAEVKDTEAHAAQRMADAQFKLGPQASKTQAQALEHAANAGGKTMPV